jgi:hypothetical protein
MEIIIEVATNLGGGNVSWRFYLSLGMAVLVAAALYWLLPPIAWRLWTTAAAFVIGLATGIVWESRRW